MRDNNDDTPQMGKAFLWIAWVLGLGILVIIFQDVLDKQWNPNTSPDSALLSSGGAQVTLRQNRAGHYVTSGTINNEPVVFLLDTGATQVSIPAQVADRLYLQTSGQYPVNTANGTVIVYRTQIDTLTIGNIILQDVSAHINPGMLSDEILLGMSALKKVEFSQTGKQLILQQR
ncbi:TIGR02281 family clan AA aspartic protease [Thalassotalea euphylliae]|uniref:retropepsin-like aspartic protease family protein n=1 Tax=Thalassotalea euphylliae TaxID=1655234 RepID=UPI0036452C56